jgi:hypothetical protein
VGSADLPSAGAFGNASICVDCKLACSIAPLSKALFKTRYEGQKNAVNAFLSTKFSASRKCTFDVKEICRAQEVVNFQ